MENLIVEKSMSRKLETCLNTKTGANKWKYWENIKIDRFSEKSLLKRSHLRCEGRVKPRVDCNDLTLYRKIYGEILCVCQYGFEGQAPRTR